MFNLSKSRQILLYALLLITLGLAACGPSADELAATAAAETEAAVPTETPVPTATNTPEPTATPTPTETPVPSPTATPKPAAVVGENGVSILEGPGSVYAQAGNADAGREMDVLGQAYDCEWIEVRLLGVGQGWVPASAVELNVPCEGLEEATIPPTPAGAVSAPPATDGGETDSGGESDVSCNNPVAVRVDNKTGENATIILSGTCNYTFTIPPTNGFQIFVVAGRYNYTFIACGRTSTGVNAINSSWRITLNC